MRNVLIWLLSCESIDRDDKVQSKETIDTVEHDQSIETILCATIDRDDIV